MPPPRKIDLLPAEFRTWLQEELKEQGFGGYVELAERLNFRLEEEGLELRIGKTAIHAYGQEYQEFLKYQEQASAWAQDWMNDNGLEEEAQRHNVMFQMLTTLAFKVMQNQMTADATEIDPRDLHFLGKMMKDLMGSAGIREKLLADDRERIAKEARLAAQKEMADKLEEVAGEDGLSAERVAQLRRTFLGVRS